MTPMALKCSKCEHTWVERINLPMDVTAFCDRVNAWSKSCPSCCKRFKDGDRGIVMLTGETAERVIAADSAIAKAGGAS